jgi:hypothetical protein
VVRFSLGSLRPGLKYLPYPLYRRLVVGSGLNVVEQRKNRPTRIRTQAVRPVSHRTYSNWWLRHQLVSIVTASWPGAMYYFCHHVTLLEFPCTYLSPLFLENPTTNITSMDRKRMWKAFPFQNAEDQSEVKLHQTHSKANFKELVC